MLEHMKNHLPDNWDLNTNWDLNCDWDIPDVSIPFQSDNEPRNIAVSEGTERGKKAK